MDIRGFFKKPIEEVTPSSSTTPAREKPTEPFVSNFERLPAPKRAEAPKGSSNENELWTVKYAPKTMSDLVGNPGSIQIVHSWLKTWDDIHIKKNKHVDAHEKHNPGGRGLFISGPPGIGKTSTVTVIARDLGFDVIELNASDARSKLAIKDVLSKATQNAVFSFQGTSKKRVVVMDEVDGMSSADNGGIRELMGFIATSRVPIVCICNEVKPSLKTLKSKCCEAKFIRPQPQTIVKRIQDIARAEALSIDDDAIRLLVESSGNDVRHIINDLQMWSRTQGSASKSMVHGALNSMNKDMSLRLSFFDSVQGLFDSSLPYRVREELYFVDHSISPLVVSEKAALAAWSDLGDPLDNFERFDRVAASVCDLDQVSAKIHRDMDFSFLPLEAGMCIRSASMAKGRIGFPGFPEYLGKNSTNVKRNRLVKEIAARLRCTSTATRMEYMEPLRDLIIRPLKGATGAQGVPGAVNLAIAYNLSRENIFDTMNELQFCSDPSKWKPSLVQQFPDAFLGITPATKAAFTRLYNKTIEEEGLTELSMSMVSAIPEPSVTQLGQEEEEEEEEEAVSASTIAPLSVVEPKKKGRKRKL